MSVPFHGDDCTWAKGSIASCQSLFDELTWPVAIMADNFAWRMGFLIGYIEHLENEIRRVCEGQGGQTPHLDCLCSSIYHDGKRMTK